MENAAQTVEDTPVESSTQQFLTFKLGDENYGLDIMRVMEIRGWIEATRLPNTPEFILGVINLRGSVVPILDMGQRFGMGEAVLTTQSVVIILHAKERTLGVLVDSVSDILDVKSSDIKVAPPMSSQIDDAYLSGLVAVGDSMVVLLNSDKMFSGPILTTIASTGEESTGETTKI